MSPGQSVTLKLSGTVPSGATGTSYVNKASASASDATTVTATDTDTLNAQATLAITKTDGTTSVVPGTTDTYTIVVSNTGPSDAANVSVADTLPAQGLTNVTSPNLPGSVTFNAGTWTVGTLAAGQSVTLQLSGTVPSGATGTSYVNKASASASDATTVTATDTDALTAQATLAITKTDGVTSVVAGSSDTYTIVVSNTGPSDAANVSVADTLPAQGLTNVTSPNLPGSVTFNAGTWTVGTLAAGQSVTLQLSGTVPSGATGTSYVNKASASASDATTVTATDTDTLNAQATLAITKTDGTTSVVPGTTDTYTIVVSNTGPSDAANVSVADTLPAQGLTNVTSPNLPGSVTFNAGTWTVGTLAAGQSVTLQLSGTVPSGATGTSYVNKASASASDATTVTATDTDTLNAQATLAITKTDGTTSVVPGSSDTYTIVVSNTGPSDAANVSVADTLPAQGLTNVTSPNLPGSVTFNAGTWTVGTLAAGQSVTLQLSGTVPSGATGTSYVNKASASASDATTVTATDTDTLNAQATLAITKTDGTTSVVPGTTDTYTIVVSNTGPSDAANVSVADTLPAQGLTNVTSPNLPGSVTFNAGTWTVGTLAAGQSVTLQLSGTVPSGATGTSYVNKASASASDATTVTATDTDTLNAQATLAITKTDGTTSVVPGTTDTYTIVVSNTGPSDAANVSVADTLPAQGLTNVTSPNLPGSVTFNAGTWTVGTLAAGQSVTLQLSGTVPSGATGTSYVNKASASASDATTVTATDTDTLAPSDDLTLTKTDNDGGSVTAGGPITYTIVAHDTGPSDAADLKVVDTLPAQGLTNISSPDLPTGAVFNAATDTWSMLSLAAGQSITLKLQGTVPSGATGSTYVNTATASASDATTMTATDTDTLNAQANLTITKTDGVSSVVPGTTDTYTIVVSNTGPSDAANVSVSDTLPAQGLTNISSPGLPAGVLFDPTTDTWTLSSLAAGQSVTLGLSGTLPSDATGTTYVNTATASASDAPAVSATDTDALTAQATLGITKTDNDGGSSATHTAGSAVPGTSITYTIVATNAGPSTATGASVTDALASNPAIGSDTWTATGSGGTTGFSASGTGSIADSLTIPSGGSVTYTVVATIVSSATGTLSNTATASATDASSVSATDTDSLSAQAALAISKTDGVASVVAGTSDTYTVVVSNSGPSDASNLNVVDALPAQGLTNIASPSLPAGVAFHPATNSWSLSSLPAGQSVTLTLSGTVPSGATGATYVNTVTASAADALTVTGADSDSLSAQATLAMTKTDGVASIVAGTSDTYTIVVSNTGPSDASNLSVADTLPVQGLLNVSSPGLPSGVTFNSGTATLGAWQPCLQDSPSR